MTNFILCSLLFFFSMASYAEESSVGSSKTEVAKISPDWLANIQYGLVTSPFDNNVREQWDHEGAYSRYFSASVYRAHYWLMGQCHFFYGGGIGIGKSSDKLSSGAGISRIVTDTQLLLGTAGVAYQPLFLGGKIGGYLFASYILLENTSTELQAQSFSRDLENDHLSHTQSGLGVYYAVNSTWRPFISFEGGRADITTLGITYGF